MTVRPRFEGDEAGRCGGCGSRRMMVTPARDHVFCLDCRRLQELETRDWPESRMCDNCAFRRGSPERADPYRWAEIQSTLAGGQQFHCHKGLAVALGPDNLSATFSPPDPASGRVTVCAGWLAAYIAHLNRQEKPHV
jgi:hypothetical protein